MSLFRSFSNVPIIKPPTREEMAADLATETCERYKALREDAKAAEANCEPSKVWTAQAAECIQTIDALMRGQHRWIVVPIILEHLPELVTPATLTPEQLAMVEAKYPELVKPS